MMHECLLYSEPELYDLLFPGSRASPSMQDEARRRRIIASEQLYLDEARQSGGRVLELACGSGRLTVPIAQNGIEIVGADLSESMLAAARAKAHAAGVQALFVRADMRSFDLRGRFTAILIPGNSLLHLLAIDDLKQCLVCVRRHLAPGGRLVFDISNWELRRLAPSTGARRPLLRLNDPKRGEITVEETADYDAAAQIRHVMWYLSAPGAPDFRVIDYHLRVIFPQELLLLLEITGFRLVARYGEFPRGPFDASSLRQVCICKPAG